MGRQFHMFGRLREFNLTHAFQVAALSLEQLEIPFAAGRIHMEGATFDLHQQIHNLTLQVENLELGELAKTLKK